MATQIGELFLTLGLDPSKLYRELDRAKRNTLKTAQEIERSFDLGQVQFFDVKNIKNADRALKQVQRNQGRSLDVSVSVDDSSLTKLNAHFDLKQAHAAKLQEDLRFKVSVDDGELKGLRLQRGSSGQPLKLVGELKTNEVKTQLNTVVDLLGALVKLGSKKPGFGSGIKSLAGNVFGNLIGGAAQAVTAQLAGNLTVGLSESIEAAIAPTLGSSRLLGRKLGDSASKAIAQAIEDSLPDEIKAALQGAIDEALPEQERLIEGLSLQAQRQAQRQARVAPAREQAQANRRDTLRAQQTLKQQRLSVNAERSRLDDESVRGELLQQRLQGLLEGARFDGDDLAAQEYERSLLEVGDRLAAIAERQAELVELDEQLNKAFSDSKKRIDRAKEQLAVVRPEELPQAYRDAIRRVTGQQQVSEEQAPQLVVDDAGLAAQGARAIYGAESNTIKVTGELMQAIEQNSLTLEQMEDLYHELQHAQDWMFGQFEGVQARRRNEIIGEQVRPTGRELQEVTPLINQYQPEQRGFETNAEVRGRRNARAAMLEQQAREAQAQIYAVGGYSGERYAAASQAAISGVQAKLDDMRQLAGAAGISLSDGLVGIEETLSGLSGRINQTQQQIERSPEAAPEAVVELHQQMAAQLKEIEQIQAVFDEQKTAFIGDLKQAIARRKEEQAQAARARTEAAALAAEMERQRQAIAGPWVGEPLGQPLQVPERERQLEAVELRPVQVPRQAAQKVTQLTEEYRKPLEFVANTVEQVEKLNRDLRQQQSNVNPDAAIAQAREIGEKFKGAYANFKAAQKDGNIALARAYAESIERASQQARAELDSITDELKSGGFDTAFSSELGSRINNLKSQLSQKRNASSRYLQQNPLPDSPPADPDDELSAPRLNTERQRIGRSISAEDIEQLREFYRLLDEAEDHADNFDRAFAKADKQSQQRFDNAAAGAEDMFDKLVRGEEIVSDTDKQLGGLGRTLLDVAKGFAAFQVLSVALPVLGNFAVVATDAAVEYDRLVRQVEFSEGSYEEATNKLSELREEARRLGTDFAQAAQGYANLAAATQNSSLEGFATDQIAKGVETVAAARQLTVDQQQRIYLATEQIASKGTLSAEELQQFAEAGFSGVRGIAARSQGLSGGELAKELQRGAISAEEFLPGFFQQVQAELGGQAVKNADSYTGSLNRMNAAINNIQVTAGQGLLPAKKMGVDLATRALEALHGAVTLLAQLLATLALTSLVQVGKAFQGVALGATRMGRAVLGAGKMVKAAGALVKTFGLQFLAIQGAIMAGQIALELFRDASGGLNKTVEASNDSIDRLIEKLNQAAEAGEKAANSLEQVKVRGLIGQLDTRNFVEDAQEYVASGTGSEALGGLAGRAAGLVKRTSPLVQGLAGLAGFQARKQQNDVLKAIEDMSAGSAKLAEEANSFLLGDNRQTIEDLRTIDKQLEDIRLKQQALKVNDPGNSEGMKALREQEAALLEQRSPLVEETGAIQGELDRRIAVLKQARENLDNQLANREINSATYNKAVAKNAADLKLLEERQRRFDDAIGDSVDTLERLARKLSDVSTELEASNFRVERSLNDARINLEQQRPSLTSGRLQSAQQQLELGGLQQQLQNYERAIAGFETELTSATSTRILGNLGIQDYQALAPSEVAQLQEQLGEGAAAEQQVLEYVARLQQARQESQRINLEIARGAADAQQALIEAGREIGEFYAGVVRSSEEVSRAVESNQLEAEVNRQKAALVRAVGGFSDKFFGQLSSTIVDLAEKLFEPLSVLNEVRNSVAGLNNAMTDELRSLGQLRTNLPGSAAGGPVVSPLAAASIDELVAYQPTQGQSFRAYRDRRSGPDVHGGVDFDSRVGGGGGDRVVAPVSGNFQVYDIAEQKGDRGNAVGVRLDMGNGTEVRLNHLNLSSVQAALGQGIGGSGQIQAGQDLGAIVNHHLDMKVSINGEKVDVQQWLAAMQAGSGTVETLSGSTITVNTPQVAQPTPEAIAPPPRVMQPGGNNNGIPPEVMAFLDTIAYAEGADYNVQFSGKTFSDMSRHPDEVITANGYSSSAAGRYQFLSSTWGELQSQLGLSDFSPESQDRGAVQLLERRGALDDVLSGNIRQALIDSAPEWASLPTESGESYYGQPVKSFDELMRVYGEALARRQGSPSAAGSPAAFAAQSPDPRLGDAAQIIRSNNAAQVASTFSLAESQLELGDAQFSQTLQSGQQQLVELGRQFQDTTRDVQRSQQDLLRATELDTPLLALGDELLQIQRDQSDRTREQSREVQDLGQSIERFEGVIVAAEGALGAAQDRLGRLELLSDDASQAAAASLRNRIEELSGFITENKAMLDEAKGNLAEFESLAANEDAIAQKRRSAAIDRFEREQIQQSLPARLEAMRRSGQGAEAIGLEFGLAREDLDRGFNAQLESLEILKDELELTGDEYERLKQIVVETNQLELGNLAAQEQRQREELQRAFSDRFSQGQVDIASALASNVSATGFGTQARQIEEMAQVRSLELQLDEDLRAVDELGRSAGLSAEKVAQLRNQAVELNAVRLDGVREQFSLAGELVPGVKNSFQGFFESVLTGSESIGDALLNFGQNILSQFASLASQKLTDELFGGLFGADDQVAAAESALAQDPTMTLPTVSPEQQTTTALAQGGQQFQQLTLQAGQEWQRAVQQSAQVLSMAAQRNYQAAAPGSPMAIAGPLPGAPTPLSGPGLNIGLASPVPPMPTTVPDFGAKLTKAANNAAFSIQQGVSVASNELAAAGDQSAGGLVNGLSAGLPGVFQGLAGLFGGGGGGVGGIFGSILSIAMPLLGGFSEGGRLDGKSPKNRRVGSALGELDELLKKEGPAARIGMVAGKGVLAFSGDELILSKQQSDEFHRLGLAEVVGGFKDGGPVGAGRVAPSRSAQGAVTNSVSVTNNITMQGQGQGEQGQGRNGGVDERKLNDAVRSAVVRELVQQQRPGGVTYRR